MKIKILLGSVFLSSIFTTFGSVDSSFEGRVFEAAQKCEASAASPVAHDEKCGCGVRIELGFDGNDNVLSPAANQKQGETGKSGRSSVFVAATALILASRSLKSR